MDPKPFSPAELRRYSRHVLLPEIGLTGQEKLRDSAVLLIGAGGLGSPLALYLAAAGVGRLGLVDFDVVDESNLHRQVIHGTSDVGRSKLDSATEKLRDINPHIEIQTFPIRLTSANAMEIFRGFDVVADGTDNFPTRYLSNDACVLLGKPNVHGSIFRFDGQATVFDARHGPCYRCLFPEPPPPGAVPSCAEGGVLGVLPGMIAMIQATETIKIITGIGEPLYGRLLQYDALQMEFHEFRLKADPECCVCGEKPSVTKLIDYQGFCGVPQHGEIAVPELAAFRVKQKLDRGDEFLFLDVREPNEYETAHIDGTRLVPLGELDARLAELTDWKDRPIVVHCLSGARSEKACKLLLERGFSDVTNMTGGIQAWSLTVDASVPRY